MEYQTFIEENLEKFKIDFENSGGEECGKIIFIQNDIVQIIGLPNVFLNEVIELENLNEFSLKKSRAIVMSINEYIVTAICFEKYVINLSSTIAKRTGKFLEVLVSEAMLGHTFDGFGNPLTSIIMNFGEYIDINIKPPEILDIVRNNQQLITGTQVIDVFMPLAYGQRQALIGDTGTGKTTIITNIINSISCNDNTLSIYLSIGQNITNVKIIEQNIRTNNSVSYIMMHVGAGNSSIEKYLSVFTALSIAEYFKRKKYDVVVFIDDMNSHAGAYQDIITRMKQPMGKEGLPSDIFYQHAMVLSIGQVHKDGGSITIMPVVITIDEDITDYLVTNIMSITDGQIIMNSKMSKARKYPAININKSVSRIGRSIQHPLFKDLCTKAVHIMLKYNNLMELSILSNDKIEDEESQNILQIGRSLDLIIYDGKPKSFLCQVVTLYLLLIENEQNIDVEKVVLCSMVYIADMEINVNLLNVVRKIVADYRGL